MNPKENDDQNIWDCLSPEYQVIGILGQGRYGKVVKAKCKLTGQNVAIKLIRDVFSGKAASRDAVRELQLMHELSHME